MYSDGSYLARNPTWHAEDAAWKAEKVIGLLRRHGVAPRSVVEIGSGTGDLLLHLADAMGADVTFHGWDVSPDAHARAAPRARTNVAFHLGDGLRDDGGDHDLVLVIDVLEHVEDYLAFARRVAKLGTDKLFHIPLELSVQTVLRRAPIEASRRQYGHLHYFTRETALATIEDAGMSVVAERFTFSSLEQPAPRLRRRFARIPRRIAIGVHQGLAVRVLGGASLLVLAR
jgi:ubiquinone/menaquinone biosynthesis C-methylase UbiE